MLWLITLETQIYIYIYIYIECFGRVCFVEVLLCSFQAVRNYWKITGHSQSKDFTLWTLHGQCYRQVVFWFLGHLSGLGSITNM